MKEKLNAFLGQKKIRKDNCLVLVLAGILLLVAVWPVNSSKKSKETDSMSDMVEAAPKEETPEQVNQAYCTYWEEKLAALLSDVRGAGTVKVMVYVGETEEQILLKDYESGENRFTEETVYVLNEKGQKTPFVVKRKLPQVAGVLVAAQGAGNHAVAQNIRSAVSALFELDESKIMVLPLL